MATQVTTINDSAWTELGTGLTAAVLQGAGDLEVYVGATAPGASNVGFRIKSGEPVQVPDVAALGGGVWVRSERPLGNVTYAIS